MPTETPPPCARVQALGGLHHPELRFQDAMKYIFKLVAAGKRDQARAAYRRMWSDCLVTTGRKTGDDNVRHDSRCPPGNVVVGFLVFFCLGVVWCVRARACVRVCVRVFFSSQLFGRLLTFSSVFPVHLSAQRSACFPYNETLAGLPKVCE